MAYSRIRSLYVTLFLACLCCIRVAKTEDSCATLNDVVGNCSSAVLGNLDIFKAKIPASSSQLCGNISNAECVDATLCGSAVQPGCLHSALAFKDGNCTYVAPSNETSPMDLHLLVSVLTSVCQLSSVKGKKTTCAFHLTVLFSMFNKQYEDTANPHHLQPCNVSELLPNVTCSDNCVTVLTNLDSNLLCCMKSLKEAFNDTANVSFEVSASAWSKCNVSSTCPPPIATTTKTPTPAAATTRGTPQPSPSTKAPSSHLVASIVIALLIFLVVFVIFSRMVIKRIRLRRLRQYEDYGYSQLQSLEASHYDSGDREDSDDEKLLSAT